MKHKNSKIGEYGIKWQAVDGYRKKNGKTVPPHMKKVEYEWKKYSS